MADARGADSGAVPGSRWLPRLALSVVLGGLLAWLAARGGVPLIPPASAFEVVQWWAVPGYLVSLVVLHVLRAARWRFLVAPIKPLPLREVISINWVGFFAIFLLPLRLGELVRPALGKSRHGIPISAGVGTVAVERVVDGLLTGLCVAFALFWLPRLSTADPIARHLPTYGLLAVVGFAAALTALGAFLWQRALARRVTRAWVGILSPRLGDLVADKVDGVAEGVRSLGSVRLGGLFALESVAYWGTNALGVWGLGVGCGLPGFGLGHAVAVMGVLAIGILLPAGPGLFGSFQLAAVACLRLYYPDAVVVNEGAVFVFLLYVLQSGVMVVAGLLPMLAWELDLRALARGRDGPEPLSKT